MSSHKSLRIIAPYLAMGGAERHLSYVLPALAQKGWKIKLLVLSHDLPLKDHFNHPNITLLSLPPPSSQKLIPSSLYHFFQILKLLIRDFRKDRQTLTHFFLPKAYCIGMVLGKLCKLHGPLMMSRRSLNLYQKRYKILSLERFLHSFCDVILVNSNAIEKQLIQEENVPQNRIHLIYNGLPESIEKPFLKTETPSFKMLVVANLIPYKGHLDLFKALNLIKKDLGENWTLTLVGQDRGIFSFLQQKAKELGIETNIEWVLDSHDPRPYLLKASIGILPSHEEGFSNALLEMMSFSLPVIATKVGGNSEAIIPGKTGLLIPPHDPEALSKAILELYHHPERYSSMGKEGLKRFQKHFTLKKCVKAYEDVYRSLLKKSLN
ncbi:MAG: glycosyltransferase family 4 protein [Proteobacteria bacterium]|nr:glycosyltransferase family 4 protein [Pseudomonadota bacterium]